MAGEKSGLKPSAIFRVWWPLAATWLMMSVEGPFIASVIARLAEPKMNLAAYGVSFAFGLLMESPIILIMSASTALVEGRDSYLKLRNFTNALNAAITALMVLLLLPPLFLPLARDLIELPEPIAILTHGAAILMLPWPAAIGFRRFYQGILIRNGLTRRVAYGTVVRLSTMAAAAVLLSLTGTLDGAAVGTAALSAGVIVEAVASRFMAARVVRGLMAEKPEGERGPAGPLTYASIWRFYYPLALTSMLIMGVNPLVTFFLGRSRMAVESLATLPVVHSLVFFFGSVGLAYQETAIALLGPRREGFKPLARFAVLLGACGTAGLALIVFTPLSDFWFLVVSGLSAELAAVALTPAQILFLMPALTVLVCFQRAILVAARTTRPVTLGTALEVAGIVAALFVGVRLAGLVGVTAAAASFLTGRLLDILFLWLPTRAASAPLPRVPRPGAAGGG